jgi:hypothetical protein
LSSIYYLGCFYRYWDEFSLKSPNLSQKAWDEFLPYLVIWDVIFSQGAILWLKTGTGRPPLA